MSKVDRRRNAPRTPEAAGLNTLDWAGVTFTELPAATRSSDITVLVAVVAGGDILAVAEAELPRRRPPRRRPPRRPARRRPSRIAWAALRTPAFAPTDRQLSHWRTGVRMLLRGVHREDRGREG